MKKFEIRHPKCKEIVSTIEIVVNPVDVAAIFMTTNYEGWEDWYSDLESAKEYCRKSNEETYNGNKARDIAESRAYDRSEQAYYQGGGY